MKRVCALALPGVVTFDVGYIVQTFARGPGLTGEPAGFTLTVCGIRPGPVTTPDGLGLHVDHGLDALEEADIVVVPGRFPADPTPPPEVLDALRAAHDRGATVASVCTAAFVLGHAGLLDGRTATTHWAFADELARMFPRVKVDPAPLFVDEGDILTSAGLAAGLDLCLHLVRREAGAATAADLARWNVVGPHRDGGQAQFVPLPRPAPGADGLGPVLAWALDHLDEPLSLAVLAGRACLSPRTLSRRFETELGISPKRWVLGQRVARALELLADSARPIDDVARQAGFPSTAALRHHLDARLGMTPTAYRRTFAGPGSTRRTPAPPPQVPAPSAGRR